MVRYRCFDRHDRLKSPSREGSRGSLRAYQETSQHRPAS